MPASSAAAYHSLDCTERLYLCTPRRKTSLLFAKDKLKHHGCVLVTMAFTTGILLFKSIIHTLEHSFYTSTKAFPRFLLLKRKANQMTAQRKFTTVLSTGNSFSMWDQQPYWFRHIAKLWLCIWVCIWVRELVGNTLKGRYLESIITADGCTTSRNRNQEIWTEVAWNVISNAI